ncbi:hypothetical protein [Nitriliruptor alkaliphilus]|uniref:COG1470 family protein n=1 Tax=Nitriliruptor alkaliphilus TaxID=427918 RepID=UPI0006988E2C|nr:hypothetical protein [Nitriliruptor alkaliphilus]
MGAIAALEPVALSVEPGGEATATLRVRNAGAIVDEFTFEVVGDAAGWTIVMPPVLRLLPGAEEVAQVTLRPPRAASTPAGDVPFGIKVNSKEDPSGAVVEEGVARVTPFGELTAELLPRTSQGRRKAYHELAVDNRGNERLNTDVLVFDDDELLEFEVEDPGLVIEPGQARFTKLQVRPRERFWRGPNKTLPFHVQLLSDDGIGPVNVEGTLVQRAVLPKWLMWALLGLLALVALLVLLWFTVFRPTIESAARDSVQDAVDEAVEDAVDAAVAAGLADQQNQVDDLTVGVNDLLEAQGQEPIELTPREVATARDLRLSVTAAPGATRNDSFGVGEGETFQMSDIVLQNPRGNAGELRILRGEQRLLVVALENFRDLDYHFVSPVVFNEGDALVLQVACGADSTACEVGAYVSGTLVTTAPPAEEAVATGSSD